MKSNLFNVYSDAIVNAHSDAVNIHEPHTPGAQHNVLFAQTNSGKHVFKFGSSEIVRKNAAVSNIYSIRGIPAPRITARVYNDLHFEEYKILPGRTLYEAVNAGIGGEQIRKIYRTVLQHFAKMENIYPDLLTRAPINYIDHVARENIANTNNQLLGKLFMVLVYALNKGAHKDIALYHSDITPKNVIVSDDGNFVGFVDMDSVCICNKNFAFATLAAKYMQLGFDIDELYTFYEQHTQNKLNRGHITAMANLSNFGKKLLWHHANRKR